LLSPLLLLWLLRGLSPPLLRLGLGALLLCWWRRTLLLPALLPFRLALSLLLAVLLRIRGNYRSEKQNQGNRSGASSELHKCLLPSSLKLDMHADDQFSLSTA